MSDVPESDWQPVPNATRSRFEFDRFATRVGVVVVTTSDRPLGRGLGYQTRVTLDGDESVVLSDPDEGQDESLIAARARHREACWYRAKAERQAQARARIKGRLG